jgi:hypothetical protein
MGTNQSNQFGQPSCICCSIAGLFWIDDSNLISDISLLLGSKVPAKAKFNNHLNILHHSFAGVLRPQAATELPLCLMVCYKPQDVRLCLIAQRCLSKTKIFSSYHLGRRRPQEDTCLLLAIRHSYA